MEKDGPGQPKNKVIKEEGKDNRTGGRGDGAGLDKEVVEDYLKPDMEDALPEMNAGPMLGCFVEKTDQRVKVLLPLVLPILIKNKYLPIQSIRNSRIINQESKRAVDDALLTHQPIRDVELLKHDEFQLFITRAQDFTGNPFLTRSSTMEIEEGNIQNTVEILQRFGHQLRKLELRLDSLEGPLLLMETLSKILDRIPNIEDMLVAFPSVMVHDDRYANFLANSNNFPELLRLKTLGLDCYYFDVDDDGQVAILVSCVRPMLLAYAKQLTKLQMDGFLFSDWIGLEWDSINFSNLQELIISVDEQLEIEIINLMNLCCPQLKRLQVEGSMHFGSNMFLLMNKFRSTLVELQMSSVDVGQSDLLKLVNPMQIQEFPKLTSLTLDSVSLHFIGLWHFLRVQFANVQELRVMYLDDTELLENPFPECVRKEFFGMLPKLKRIILLNGEISTDREFEHAVAHVYTRPSKQIFEGHGTGGDMEVEILENITEMKNVSLMKKSSPESDRIFGSPMLKAEALFPLVLQIVMKRELLTPQSILRCRLVDKSTKAGVDNAIVEIQPKWIRKHVFSSTDYISRFVNRTCEFRGNPFLKRCCEIRASGETDHRMSMEILHRYGHELQRFILEMCFSFHPEPIKEGLIRALHFLPNVQCLEILIPEHDPEYDVIWSNFKFYAHFPTLVHLKELNVQYTDGEFLDFLPPPGSFVVPLLRAYERQLTKLTVGIFAFYDMWEPFHFINLTSLKLVFDRRPGTEKEHKYRVRKVLVMILQIECPKLEYLEMCGPGFLFTHQTFSVMDKFRRTLVQLHLENISVGDYKEDIYQMHPIFFQRFSKLTRLTLSGKDIGRRELLHFFRVMFVNLQELRFQFDEGLPIGEDDLPDEDAKSVYFSVFPQLKRVILLGREDDEESGGEKEIVFIR